MKSLIKRFEKPIEDQIHDMTLPSSIHNLPVHDTHNCIDNEDWLELLTNIDCQLGREHFEGLSANAKAINDAKRMQADADRKFRTEQALRARANDTSDKVWEYSRKYRQYNTDARIVTEYLQRQSIDALNKLAKDLENRAWRSLFSDKNHALQLVQFARANRRR